MMVTGKVVRFDEVRGYGFIAPDGGGEDVFVHANVLGNEKYVFAPGLRVGFEATDGDRGPKAHAVRLLAPPIVAAPAPAAAGGAAPVLPPAAPLPAAPPAGEEPGGEELCDVFTARDFGQEITEIVLRCAPEVTGAQLLGLRGGLIAFGAQHGWVED
jgi:CspA family cold shock protein